MKVSALMSTNLVAVKMDDHLGKLKAVFKEYAISSPYCD